MYVCIYICIHIAIFNNALTYICTYVLILYRPASVLVYILLIFDVYI